MSHSLPQSHVEDLSSPPLHLLRNAEGGKGTELTHNRSGCFEGETFHKLNSQKEVFIFVINNRRAYLCFTARSRALFHLNSERFNLIALWTKGGEDWSRILSASSGCLLNKAMPASRPSSDGILLICWMYSTFKRRKENVESNNEEI